MKLEAGEQYLSINKGDGVAVWVRMKTSPQKEEKVTAGDLL